MPVPIDSPGSRPGNFYVRETQDWAVTQERQRHAQALYQVGEWAGFFLMWHEIDFEAGLVRHCTRCYSTSGSVASRIGEVYHQPTQNRCPDCFGTLFEGGYRARIVRPALFSDSDESEQQAAKGTMHPATATVESTTDFRLREGDYVIRADNTRWRTSTPQRVMLRTGFGHPDQRATSIAYNSAPARLEDRTSVAYLLPAERLVQVLLHRSHEPADFGDWETIRGPLLPDGLVS